MKALTVKQPYATAIDLGYKTIEIRSWPTEHRGPILITASARPIVEVQGKQLVVGTTICVVSITDCRRMKKSHEHDAMVDFHKDFYSWMLRYEYTVVKKPVKGKLGLWEIDDDLIVRDKSNPNRRRVR